MINKEKVKNDNLDIQFRFNQLNVRQLRVESESVLCAIEQQSRQNYFPFTLCSIVSWPLNNTVYIDRQVKAKVFYVLLNKEADGTVSHSTH